MSTQQNPIFAILINSDGETSLFDQYFDTKQQAATAIGGLINKLQHDHPDLTTPIKVDDVAYQIRGFSSEYTYTIQELTSFSNHLVADHIIGKVGFI